MLYYYITIISKNKSSIKKFFIFFTQALNNFDTIKKHLKKKQKRKFLTILKSPHVNKVAQEQFEAKLFSNQVNICYSPKNLQFLILLKKTKTHLFPDVKMKIKFSLNKFLIKKTQLKILNPSSFRLNFFSSIKKRLKKTKRYRNYQYNKQKIIKLNKTKSLIKIFDTYGNLIKVNV